MKHTILALLALSLLSCSSDDNENNGSTITVQQNILMNIDENPQPNQVIGVVSATSSNPITFAITEQTLIDAFIINSTTGELIVGDASFFDFETNAIIQVTVEVSDGIDIKNIDVQVELNNKDDIEFLLSNSKQDYIAAQIGDWIEVTEEEYEILANALNEVKRAGFYQSGALNVPSTDGIITLANLNSGSTNSMPGGSLVFGFKYLAVSAQLTDDRHRVKQSSSTNSTGFENVGNLLPSHEKDNEVACFVLKGCESAITSNEGFLGFQKSSGATMGIVINDGTYLFSLGEASDFTSEANGSTALYEGLSTIQKQWN